MDAPAVVNFPALPVFLVQAERVLRRIRFSFILIPIGVVVASIVLLFGGECVARGFPRREFGDIWVPWLLFMTAIAAGTFAGFYAVLRWRRTIPAAIAAVVYAGVCLLIISELCARSGRRGSA